MNTTFKNVLSFILRVGLSALLLWFLSTKIDLAKTIIVVKSARFDFFLMAFGVFFITNIIIFWRWFILVKALDLNASAFEVLRFFFFGLFGNLFLPSAIGGDVIKILGLCKNSEQKPKVVASVILDRLSGFAGITLVATVSFLLGNKIIDDASLVVPVVVLAMGSLVVGLILFHEKTYSFCCSIFNALPRFKDVLMNIHYDISLMKNKKTEGLQTIFFSVLAQGIFACSFFLITRALNQHIPLIYFFIFVPLICVASMVPSIGGLGVREAGAAFLFAKVGVDSGVAVSMSLINFLFMVVVGLAGGLFYVLTLSSGRMQHQQPVIPLRSKEG